LTFSVAWGRSTGVTGVTFRSKRCENRPNLSTPSKNGREDAVETIDGFGLALAVGNEVAVFVVISSRALCQDLALAALVDCQEALLDQQGLDLLMVKAFTDLIPEDGAEQ
jgi:hypothetical protein